MSPIGKPRFISQIQARVRTAQEEHLFMTRLSSIMKSLWHKVFLLALNKAPVFSVSCPINFKSSECYIWVKITRARYGGTGKGAKFGKRSPETYNHGKKCFQECEGGDYLSLFLLVRSTEMTIILR